MTKVYAMLAFAVTGLAVSVTGMLLVLRGHSAEPPVLTQAEALRGLRVLDFELADASGEPADASLFEGEVTVLSFIFTRCPLACPGMTQAQLEAQRRLEGSSVRFASVSVDPAHDTPEVLAAYADRRGIDRSNWTLLTGDEETVHRLVRDGMRFLLETEESNVLRLPDGTEMANINHPSRLILVGPDRHVLGLYDPVMPGEVDRLVQDAEAASGVSRGS